MAQLVGGFCGVGQPISARLTGELAVRAGELLVVGFGYWIFCATAGGNAIWHSSGPSLVMVCCVIIA